MESFTSDVDNVTFNGTINDDGSSTSTSLLENVHAPVSANMVSGEITTDVVNPNTQIVIPENEDEPGEAEVHRQNFNNLHRACQQAVLELGEHARAGFRARSPLLNVNLHKYEATNSTGSKTKEHCSICLDEYHDGEELAKIDCGHIYHIGCIKDWNKIENTCPICKRRVSMVGHFTLRIHAFLGRRATTNQLSSGSAN